MKKTLSHLFGCVVTLALTLYFIHSLGYIVRPTDTDRAYYQINNLHSMTDNTFEVIVYGSSKGYSSVDPLYLYTHYGIGAYNYSMTQQRIRTNMLFIKDSLLSQKPKLALIETFFAHSVLEDTDITPEIFYTRYLKERSAIPEYLKTVFGNDPERYLSYIMPLCAFHDNWNTLTQKSFTSLSKSMATSTYIKYLGFHDSHIVAPIKLPDPASVKQKPFKEKAKLQLDELIDLCKSNGMDILFYTAPYEAGYPYSDAMKAYAEEKGYPYLNLLEYVDEMGLDGKTDFRDDHHTNTSGAEKISDYLGRYISQHYNLTDMRTVDGNIWEETIEKLSKDA